MDKTAVIIITKNRPKLLHQTIQSLMKNTPREMYDLIVLDDGSEKTHVLHELYDRGDISHLVLTNLGSLGALKNMGASIANTLGYKYVYQSDNDMYFLPGWLEKCQEVWEKNPSIGIIGPYNHPFLRPNGERTDIWKASTVDAINGNSMFTTTDLWMDFKMKETQGIMASEDWEMSQRMRESGFLCVRFVENLVLHCGITNSKGDPATGADVMLEELSQAKIKHQLKDLYYE